ncbi:hypothetical protein [Spongiactinospora sp. TRM90649]|uniref:hypothetical protein n=1 Tax=Spongiactinospora sp. TRM90649 TaxID=3031114 RepID=UPI0023F71E80|nr:hypothetical protein [Spongiactinospora sp. TRM90649]MDF5759158.1 hypothetical protein [Spongiactinospora sp. TRM90649]
MRVRSPLARLSLGLLLAAGPALAGEPAHATTATSATSVVEYSCTDTATNIPQPVSLNIELTMPTSAPLDATMTITWTGRYSSAGILAPAIGLPAGAKLFAYAGISGIDKLTSATGTASLAPTDADGIIELPDGGVTLSTTPRANGTGTVRPGDINIGTSTQNLLIKCEVTNKDALTTYPLTVGTGGTGGGSSPSPSPSPSASTSTSPSPSPSASEDDDTDLTESDGNGSVAKTPIGGASTGGGGDAGPDGRVLVLVGAVVILAAGTGLTLRRRGLHAR